MVGPVPLLPLDMNSYKLYFSMHRNFEFLSSICLTEPEWRKEVPGLPFDNAGRYSRHCRYWSSHWLIIYPFGAWMALKWNNCLFFANALDFCQCIGIYMGFWYKNHMCEKINVYNTLTADRWQLYVCVVLMCFMT